MMNESNWIWYGREDTAAFHDFCIDTDSVMLFETILQAFDLPAEEVLGQISNIRITKMWMKDSVVLLHSLNPSQWGGCCTKIINWMPVRVIY
jgi:hypothetical protein